MNFEETVKPKQLESVRAQTSEKLSLLSSRAMRNCSKSIHLNNECCVAQQIFSICKSCLCLNVP